MLVALVVLVVILGAALLAPWLAPHDPTAQNFDQMLNGPSAEHWLGTDDLGRDVFSRLMHGGANSLYAALLAVAVALRGARRRRAAAFEEDGSGGGSYSSLL